MAEALLGESHQEFLPGIGDAPQGAQLGLVFEEFWQFAEQRLHELLGGHGRAVRVPEGSGYHVLNGALFAVGQLHGRFSSANARTLTASLARLFGTHARTRPTDSTRLRRGLHALTGIGFALRTRFGFERFAIPFGIAEMDVGPHEVVNGEVVFAIVKARSAADDLFELNHGIDRTHQDYVANVAGIHAGRELLRGGQNRRDRLLIVLKVPQVLVAKFAIVRSNPLAIVRIGARLHLVDEVAHGQRMVLGGTEDQRLLALVDLFHEQLHAVLFACLDLDDLVEVGFRVALSALHFALHYVVIRRVDILVERGGNLLYAEGRKKAVIDAFTERVDVDWLAEVFVGVRVLLALWRRGQAKLNGGSKVIHDATPVAFIVGTAAVALVDDYEIEEVGRILPEIG